MASLTLPATHTQKLFVYLYLPTGGVSALTWAVADSDDFLFLYETEVVLDIPFSAQQALIPAFNAHMDKQVLKAKADFASRVKMLEDIRGKYLALEN